MKLYLFITDNVDVIVVSDTSLDTKQLELPSYKQWPVQKEHQHNNFALALARHVTFDIGIEWPEIIKPKRAFGLEKHSKWVIFKVDSVHPIVEKTNCTSKWFYRYANAKIPWTLRAIKLIDFKVHIEHIEQNVGLKEGLEQDGLKEGLEEADIHLEQMSNEHLSETQSKKSAQKKSKLNCDAISAHCIRDYIHVYNI